MEINICYKIHIEMGKWAKVNMLIIIHLFISTDPLSAAIYVEPHVWQK